MEKAPKAGEKAPAYDGRMRLLEPTLDLNQAQRRAVSSTEGPLLVIAGAGTGKTMTLVHRLVHLVRLGVPPESILLLTFTRRAAGEMIGRALALLHGEECTARLEGGTFHSFANGMLRRYGASIGLPSNYTVLDQADTHEILGAIRSDLKLSERGPGLPKRATIAAIISKATNKQVSIRKVLDEEYPQFTHQQTVISSIARQYAKFKKERAFLDFDDLLVRLIDLLEQSPEALERIRRRYSHVMVDEYQDTNALQARITDLLAGGTCNIMVVGDDAQSIYAFRGACYRNIFDFHDKYARAGLITLEQNYRSTQPILNVANALMNQMSKSFRKRLFTARESGTKPLLVQSRDEEEQSLFVVEEIMRLRKKGLGLPEMAVLFRAGRHSFGLELELESRNIPYVKYGGFKFLESAHIKDVLAHLRVIANPGDDLSLIRILRLCEAIGISSAKKIQRSFLGKSVSEGLMEYPAHGRAGESLGRLARLMADLEVKARSPSAGLGRVIEYYTPIVKAKFDDWPRRLRDLEHLMALCEKYGDLEAMLSDLAIEPPTTSSGKNLSAGDGKKNLVLSTMHSAKGLEWKAVFIIQAVEGCIPLCYSYEEELDKEKMDEELRLLYVAVTRARDSLYVVYPSETAGPYGWVMLSRFIASVPGDLFTFTQASSARRKREGGRFNRARFAPGITRTPRDRGRSGLRAPSGYTR